jgi:hypothetical protein
VAYQKQLLIIKKDKEIDWVGYLLKTINFGKYKKKERIKFITINNHE